jgi:hypothetical protein
MRAPGRRKARLLRYQIRSKNASAKSAMKLSRGQFEIRSVKRLAEAIECGAKSEFKSRLQIKKADSLVMNESALD